LTTLLIKVKLKQKSQTKIPPLLHNFGRITWGSSFFVKEDKSSFRLNKLNLGY